MSSKFRITIDVDISMGSVNVQGPITDMRVMHFALGEALRCVTRDANRREVEAAKGPQLVIAHQIPPNGGP